MTHSDPKPVERFSFVADDGVCVTLPRCLKCGRDVDAADVRPQGSRPVYSWEKPYVPMFMSEPTHLRVQVSCHGETEVADRTKALVE